ncbi:hypothetical protein MWG46_00230 [Escherichia coli]|nr:hypothetical protein [Escherichia coli]
MSQTKSRNQMKNQRRAQRSGGRTRRKLEQGARCGQSEGKEESRSLYGEDEDRVKIKKKSNGTQGVMATEVSRNHVLKRSEESAEDARS